MPKTKKTDLEALGLDELRAKFTELTGEETKDRSKKRLIGKIETELQSTEALEKGKRMREADAEPAPKKKAGKKAKARLGLRSRNDLFLRAVHAYLTENGENEVAEHFAPAE